MAISFENALGIHQKALEVRVQRAEVLANNLVNADTPGFKARDIDFKAVLGGVQAGQAAGQLEMSTTNGNHLPHGGNGGMAGSNELLYRVPTQPSLDGNTVDTQQELAEFTKNTMQYQSSFHFLNSKFKSLNNAIRGE
jgi:flagellar basal-body rod protein FlgB